MSVPPSVTARHGDPITATIEDDPLDSSLNIAPRETENVPAVAGSSIPDVPKSVKPLLRLDKALPASPPASANPSSADAGFKLGLLNRSFSGGSIGCTRSRRPVLLDDQSSIQGPYATIQAQTPDKLSTSFDFLDISSSPSASPLPPHAHPRPGKILQLTGDDSAQAFHNAKQAQANLPWYLKHRHREEEIKLEFDGTVKAGTLSALVEHLVVDPLRENWFSIS